MYPAVVALGAALGLSQAVHGLYDESTWAPIALGILALLLVFAIGAPRRIAVAVVLPLIGLAAWSLASSAWADSTDAAWIAANRWLLYAAALALMLRLLAGNRRRAEALLAAVAAGVLTVAVWMLLRMLTRDGSSLFFESRLINPLGYVNGQAGYLLAAMWPCCAAAERRRPAALAGLGLGGLVALIALGALSGSRSWELGLVASALLVVFTFPGRRRRISVFLVAGAAIFAIHDPLAAVGHQPVVSNSAAHRAAVAILLAAVLAGITWAMAVWLLERAAPAGTRQRARAARVVTFSLAALACASGVIVAVNGARIVHSVRAEYRAFVHLSPSPDTVRLLSGAGHRYDFWRVAWLEFRSEPLGGVGAGNYQAGWYRNRHIDEPITQPHSLELQTTAELGVIGGVLLAAFLAVVAGAVVRAARNARSDPSSRPLAVASAGLFVGWLVQTSVDWEHLIPGLTLIALASVAALLGLAGRPVSALRPRTHEYLTAASAVLACAGAILIIPRVLSLDARASAVRALARDDPSAAIVNATRALDYDASSVPALVLRAAAFARLDAFALARNDLSRALEVEPRNWTTWVLMGDLMSRHGNLGAARSFYRHALALDPLEPSVAQALQAAASAR